MTWSAFGRIETCAWQAFHGGGFGYVLGANHVYCGLFKACGLLSLHIRKLFYHMTPAE